MSEEKEIPLQPGERQTLLGKLMKKIADARLAADRTGGSTEALEQEAMRQVKQVSTEDTLTKSGGDD